MCEITNCRDLVDSKDRFEELKVKIKDDNPKLYKALKPLFDEVQVFMTSARFHVDYLYKVSHENSKRVSKIKDGEFKISFGYEANNE